MIKLKQYNFKRYQISMLIAVIILVTIGAFLIKQVQTEDENLFVKQLYGLVGGIVLIIIVSLIDYHFICKFFIVLYLINLGLLIWVKVDGVTVNFAQRWIGLKYMMFQPSELSKIIMILFLAKVFTIFRSKINNAFLIILSFIAMAVPTYLILTQTDLSTSMVLMFVFVMIIFAAGLSWKIIFPAIAVGIPGFIALFWYVQQDYQKILSHTQQERILSILNQDLYPKIMYQQTNSIQAIGSGQLYGKRFIENALEIRGYHFVPISESDFVFSIAGEELGFIGCCFIIALFAFIIYKCLTTAKKAPDYLGMLISVGIASMFMFQVFVNIGVATSILPNTGIPLPFLSSGLSSLMSGMIAIGIIINIRLQPKKARNQ